MYGIVSDAIYVTSGMQYSLCLYIGWIWHNNIVCDGTERRLRVAYTEEY